MPNALLMLGPAVPVMITEATSIWVPETLSLLDFKNEMAIIAYRAAASEVDDFDIGPAQRAAEKTPSDAGKTSCAVSCKKTQRAPIAGCPQ